MEEETPRSLITKAANVTYNGGRYSNVTWNGRRYIKVTSNGRRHIKVTYNGGRYIKVGGRRSAVRRAAIFVFEPGSIAKV